MKVNLERRRTRQNILVPQCIIEACQDDIREPIDGRVALR